MAASCLLLLTGCLEFEQQTLTYRYDAKTDTLRIFQVYHGIFGGDQPAGLSAKELEQLQSVLSGQRTFFFENWILEFDRGQVRQEMDRLDKPETPQDTNMDSAARSRHKAFLQALLDDVRVENGAFYLDGQHKLCGVQFVTATRFSNLVAAASEQIRDLLKTEAGREKAGAETRDLYLKAAEQPQPFVVLDGNQLRVRFPMTRAEFDKSHGPDSSAVKQLELFKNQGGKFAFVGHELTWSIGSPSDRVTTLSLPVSEKPYLANAVAAVASQTAVREQLDSAATAQSFIWGSSPKAKAPKP